MTPPTLLTEWARLLLGSLRRAGLRDVVLSPGSRSTPFTWAALQEPGLRCRSVIDERSAAFFAVGQARMTGEPTLLICTSGSAAANYFPALVEAAESATPVLVLTADRPLELQHVAAPQTIDQVELYGRHARAYFELGTPEADPRVLRAVPRLAAQALEAARSPRPGPVQLNARARKPLEPRTAEGAAETELRAVVDRLLASVPAAIAGDAAPDPAALAPLVRACRDARSGLIVCGPAAPRDAPTPATVRAMARATGFPVVAEAASQLAFVDLGDATRLDAFAELLDVPGFAADHAPELVLQLGRPPTASSWHRAMEAWTDTTRCVFAAHDWADPWSTATAVVRAPVDEAVRTLADALTPEGVADGTAGARAAWVAKLEEAGRRARALIDASLDGAFSEGAAVRTVVDTLPAGAVLAVGNSLPIREVDTFAPPAPRDLSVWFQRGANGIDGLVSGAAGAAAASGRPTTLLVGDVSFVHDLGGLRALRGLPAPLTVVVLNNGGGRIFERLPLVDALAGDPALEAWRTPPGADFEAAARVFDLPFARADDGDALAAALEGLRDTGGVLEVVIPEGGTTEHQRALRRGLASELG